MNLVLMKNKNGSEIVISTHENKADFTSLHEAWALLADMQSREWKNKLQPLLYNQKPFTVFDKYHVKYAELTLRIQGWEDPVVLPKYNSSIFLLNTKKD